MIREAFAATFSILMVIGAACCVICAIIAFIFIDDRIIKNSDNVEAASAPV